MTITRKIKRITVLKKDEDSNNNNNNHNNINNQRSSCTSSPDLTPLLISTSSIENCSLSSPVMFGQQSLVHSPALDYATLKSIPTTTTTDTSTNISTTNKLDDSCTTSGQPKYSRSNTVIGGSGTLRMGPGKVVVVGKSLVATTPPPVLEHVLHQKEDSNHSEEKQDETPILKKTKSASIITVKKKVVIYTEPQRSEINAPPVLENAAKFSLIQAANNEESERLQKMRVEELEGTDDDSTTASSVSTSNRVSPVSVYSPRAFENGLHLSPKQHHRPSLDEISGNPSKLYAFLDDHGDLRSCSSPRRSSTIDEHRRSTISKSDIAENSVSIIDLVVPEELEKNFGNYGHASLEKFMQERNKINNRVQLRGIHSMSQRLDERIENSNNQKENNSQQPTFQFNHHTFQSNEESTMVTTYKLSNCSNMQLCNELDTSGFKSFYPLPEGLLTFEIKSQCNEEKQLKISFKAKRTIDTDLHKILMELLSRDDNSSNEKIHELDDYEWTLSLETSSDIPNSREVLRRIISENQKDTSQGFQFKSFSHLLSFVGNSIQEEIKKRIHTQPITGDKMRMALVFTQNDYIPNNDSVLSADLNVQELLKDEKVSFNFEDCLETNATKEIVSCSSKILFLCVQFYSPLLDTDIQFKLPLFPTISIENYTKKERVIHTLEEQVSQLESELEEILYQKYMWEFLMKYTFKVFDSRIIDSTKVSITNQKRTLKYIGEKPSWTSCVCRCPITPGRFVDVNLETNSFPGDLSSLKTNHVITLRLDSFPTGSDIYVGIINANHTAEHILQNYVVSGKSDSHTFFLKDKQYRHGSIIVNSITNNSDSEFLWSEGDILQVVLNYSNMNIQVYRNYNQRIFPSFEGNSIDLENTEWYFIVGMNQNGQQISLI